MTFMLELFQSHSPAVGTEFREWGIVDTSQLPTVLVEHGVRNVLITGLLLALGVVSPVLYCVVLCCAAMYYAVLCCAVL